MPLVSVHKSAPRAHEFFRGRAAFSSHLAMRGVALFGVALLCAAPVRAAPLRQQWVPGQQLGYESTLSGSMTMLADDESPQPWAGLPTEFRVRGNSVLTLDTLSTDTAGVGTVALRMGDSRLRAQGFGQIFEITIRDGQVTALMNGKPSESAQTLRNAADPDWAMKVTPEGRLAEVIALKKPSPSTAAPKPQGGTDALASPFDMANAVQSWMLRAFPALWPQGEVKVGDTWTQPIAVPLPPPASKVNEAKPPAPPLRIGEATFALKGEEEIASRKVQRIALTGAFNVDAAQAKIIGDATRAATPATAPVAPTPATKKNQPSTTLDLADAKEKITGDLWLDAATGQLVRVELAMQIHAHSKGTIRNKVGRTRPTEEWVDFDGTLQMQLRKVSYASAQGEAK